MKNKTCREQRLKERQTFIKQLGTIFKKALKILVRKEMCGSVDEETLNTISLTLTIGGNTMNIDIYIFYRCKIILLFFHKPSLFIDFKKTEDIMKNRF